MSDHTPRGCTLTSDCPECDGEGCVRGGPTFDKAYRTDPANQVPIVDRTRQSPPAVAESAETTKQLAGLSDAQIVHAISAAYPAVADALARLAAENAALKKEAWHRRADDPHCGTDEVAGYGHYHAEMLSDEAMYLQLGDEVFTVYFDKKKPCLNDGRQHRKGVLQLRFEESRAARSPGEPTHG